MDVSISKTEFQSSNNKNKIKVLNYNLNKKDIKAIVIILHGMTESKELYSDFAEYLAVKGYGVITYDHIGHGESINNDDEKGYFAKENGYEYLTKDVEYVINEASKLNLPIFLFGHSMGSLIARNYVANALEEKIDGLILCGTIGQQWAIDGAIQLAEYMIENKGPRYRSRKLQEVVITAFKWKFENMKYKNEWATRDRDFIEKTKSNKKINFIFTASGFKDVFELVKITGKKESIEKIPKNLPILIISGGDDILGEYSEGIRRLEQAYNKEGIKDVTVKIYEDSRHALLHDLDKLKVYKDINDWIEVVRIANNEN